MNKNDLKNKIFQYLDNSLKNEDPELFNEAMELARANFGSPTNQSTTSIELNQFYEEVMYRYAWIEDEDFTVSLFNIPIVIHSKDSDSIPLYTSKIQDINQQFYKHGIANENNLILTSNILFSEKDLRYYNFFQLNKNLQKLFKKMKNSINKFDDLFVEDIFPDVRVVNDSPEEIQLRYILGFHVYKHTQDDKSAITKLLYEENLNENEIKKVSVFGDSVSNILEKEFVSHKILYPILEFPINNMHYITQKSNNDIQLNVLLPELILSDRLHKIVFSFENELITLKCHLNNEKEPLIISLHPHSNAEFSFLKFQNELSNEIASIKTYLLTLIKRLNKEIILE